MAIVVEDGSVVTGANSYVSRADAIAYAAARGVTLADSTATDAYILKATDYLESLADQYQGERYTRDQALCWPRAGVSIEGYDWDQDEIPRQLIAAQCALIVEISQGADPFNVEAVKGPITQESVVGAVSVTYASATSSKVRKDTNSRALITLLLKRNGFNVVRA